MKWLVVFLCLVSSVYADEISDILYSTEIENGDLIRDIVEVERYLYGRKGIKRVLIKSYILFRDSDQYTDSELTLIKCELISLDKQINRMGLEKTIERTLGETNPTVVYYLSLVRQESDK